jgi:large conductance mechanosensitive channel
MGVGFSLYGLAALYQYLSKDPIIKHTVKCRYCRKRINEKVGETSGLTSSG